MAIFLLVLILAGLLFGAVMYRNAIADTVTINNLSLPDFPSDKEQLTIFFISDIHRRTIKEELLTQCPGTPDLVLIGGDIAEGGVPLERVRENIKKLRKLGPAAAVLGNNDFELDRRELEKLLKEEDVRLLHNEALRISEDVAVIGLGEMKVNEDMLEDGLKDAGDVSFKILLCHSPLILQKLKKKDGIALAISGHTHGGQIRIGKFGLYEKGRVFETESCTVLVSNGYGTSKLPLRLGAPAEAHWITISKS
ncbi:metallophosphoesterase [Metabacillus sp. GX 13764]|uniref:metallophosphoesterase n=1 Tax=Metabacillus kandeliae TaxID=2900151 RepID=UPI001E57FA92|nr:metallophosphoesterase [Metabacillus kandeliae]MCD7033336.1 metallophosphoesterase [Metabacillus kandeliae]